MTELGRATAYCLADGAVPFFTVITTGHSSLTNKRQGGSIVRTLRDISKRVPLVFPIHPRTGAAINRNGLGDLVDSLRICRLPPQGYLEMVGLMAWACQAAFPWAGALRKSYDYTSNPNELCCLLV